MSRATDEEALAYARRLVSMVVDFLAEEEWEIVANLTSGKSLSADQLEARVRGLPFTVVRTPAGAVGEIEVEPAEPRPAKTPGKRQRRRFAGVAPLWTAEGRSRWVLEMTVREVSGGFLEAQVNGFRRRKAQTPKTPEQVANDRRSLAMNPQSGPVWEDRIAEVVGRAPGDAEGRALDDGDVAGQLQGCLDDIRAQLEREQFSLSDIRDMTIRTTDFPAARAQAGALGRWQREHGAWEQTTFEPVEALQPPGAVVEVGARARHFDLVVGEVSEPKPNRPVPEHLRPAVRAELDALARGERPDHLCWVERYGDDGATLVVQPEAIWDHRQTDALLREDGGWSLVLPLWTELGCPSDLSAEVEVDPSGTVTIHTVHVM